MSNDDANAEIDIDEAMRLTGYSKRTLMRYAMTKKLTTHVVKREHTQHQRRMMFRKDEILALAGVENR